MHLRAAICKCKSVLGSIGPTTGPTRGYTLSLAKLGETLMICVG